MYFQHFVRISHSSTFLTTICFPLRLNNTHSYIKRMLKFTHISILSSSAEVVFLKFQIRYLQNIKKYTTYRLDNVRKIHTIERVVKYYYNKPLQVQPKLMTFQFISKVIQRKQFKGRFR